MTDTAPGSPSDASAVAPQPKIDRDEVFLEYTNSAAARPVAVRVEDGPCRLRHRPQRGPGARHRHHERRPGPAMRSPLSAASGTEVKACCAAAYNSDAVALLLGESYHPGGLALTRRVAAAAGLLPGQRVLDVASRPGRTALLLSAQFGVTVDGVDLAEASLRKASAAARAAGLADRVAFHRGDAERLPFPDASFDAVLCECAFCTFPDKPTAAREFARVLRPGGRVAITDVTVVAMSCPGWPVVWPVLPTRAPRSNTAGPTGRAGSSCAAHFLSMPDIDATSSSTAPVAGRTRTSASPTALVATLPVAAGSRG